jgi:hypothetical protein
MTTAIACKHTEYVDYLNGRHLGYCRQCGRTMEYDNDGGKPRDVTAEFGGNNPFPFPSAGRTAVAVAVPIGTAEAGLPRRVSNSGAGYSLTAEQRHQAAERNRARAEASKPAVDAESERPPHQRNNFARMAWYLENKAAIIADVRELGPTEARKKWNIPSSTFSHHLQVWGVAVPHRKSPEKRVAAAGERAPAIVGMPRWAHRGSKDNTAKGRYWKAHLAEIEADLRAIGPDETRRKWGMGEKWLYRCFPALASRQLWKASLSGQLAASGADHAAQVTEQVTTGAPSSQPARDAGGDSARLPAWNEAWDPTVQVQWLRSTTAIVVAETLRDDRRAVAAA